LRRANLTCPAILALADRIKNADDARSALPAKSRAIQTRQLPISKAPISRRRLAIGERRNA
jgi:hypothetical protein